MNSLTGEEQAALACTALGSPAGQAMFWQPQHLEVSPLQQHAPFLFWLVEHLSPGLVVTLGQHGSASHFSICQAVHRLALPTRCYAMAGSGQPLPARIRDEHDRQYASFSKLLPAALDEDGLQHFRCSSVDWLQVDGYAQLEQLQASWRSWRKRLSRRAILTIHQSVLVAASPLGSWLKRLQNCHPWAEFPHGEGLLILSLGEQQPEPLQRLFHPLGDPQSRGRVQSLFAELGRACADACLPAAQPALPLAQAQAAPVPSKADEVSALQERLLQAEAAMRDMEVELQQARAELEERGRRLEDRFRELGQLTRMLNQREEEMAALREQLESGAPTRKETISSAAQVQIILQSGLFDSNWYRQAYPDVAASGIAPVEHYVQHGAAERRNPSPSFDTAWYCRRYPDVAASGLNPLVHHIRYGREKGRQTRARPESAHA